MESTLELIKQNLEKCKTDINLFTQLFHMSEALGKDSEFSPKQLELFNAVNNNDKHIVCIWSRQTGKSTSFGIIVSFGSGELFFFLSWRRKCKGLLSDLLKKSFLRPSSKLFS